MGFLVGMVEEEGAAVGEADVLSCEISAVGREREDFVVGLGGRGGARGHGWERGGEW